jgi:hypothetical protein
MAGRKLGLFEPIETTRLTHNQAMLTVIETRLFQRTWPHYWTEDERGEFCAFSVIDFKVFIVYLAPCNRLDPTIVIPAKAGIQTAFVPW